MPLPEGESQLIFKALEPKKDEVRGSHPAEREGASLKTWFDKRWVDLENKEGFGDEVELPADWNEKYAEERAWIEEKLDNRRRTAANSARAYRMLVRAEIDPTLRQKKAEDVADAEKSVDLARRARGENLPQFIQLGFEYLMEDEIVAEEKQKQETGDLQRGLKKREDLPLMKDWDERILGDKPDDFDTYEQLSDRAKGYVQKLTSTIKDKMERATTVGQLKELHREISNQQRVANQAARSGEMPVDDYLYFLNLWSKYTYTLEKNMPESEFRRLGTLDAFMEFAKKREFLGPYEHADDTQKKAIDERVRQMLEASEPTTDQLREDFDAFKRWFRQWWIGELSDVTDTNPNAFISGLGQIVATLVIQGLETDRPIISIVGAMDTRKKQWKELVTDTIGQLQAAGSVNNRERVYAQVKNIAPEKVAEAMVGIANKSAGRGESLALTPDSWKALFAIGKVKPKENGDEYDTFGETFRKALALYLAREVDVLEGDLTLEQLDKYGIKVSDEMRKLAMSDTYDPVTGYGFRKHIDSVTGVPTQGHVVVKNIFPIEVGDVHSADFIKTQRDRMVDILEVSSGDRKAANLAEKLGNKAIEAGYVGAQLDYLGTSKEAMYKLIHTRQYRYKYLLQQKEAGLPLSVEDIEILMLPYFDMIMLPATDVDGNKLIDSNTEKTKYVSFKDYILGRGMVRREAASIPITQAKDSDLDYYFYDQTTQWGVRMWGFLINGLQVPWHNMLASGTSQQSIFSGSSGEIDPKHIHTLQEAYKYIGYWLSSLTVEQANAFIQPHDPKSAMRTWAWEARIPKKTYFVNETEDRQISESIFATRASRLVFRRMILRELQQYGSKYNDALRTINPFVEKHGIVLSAKDMDHIEHALLVGVSKLNMVDQLKTNDERFKELFTKKTLDTLFYAAGLTDTKATGVQLLGWAAEVAARFKLLEETRRR